MIIIIFNIIPFITKNKYLLYFFLLYVIIRHILWILYKGKCPVTLLEYNMNGDAEQMSLRIIKYFINIQNNIENIQYMFDIIKYVGILLAFIKLGYANLSLFFIAFLYSTNGVHLTKFYR